MHRASYPLGSQLCRALLVVTALIAAGCGDEGGRPFGNLKIMTGPDGGQIAGGSGSDGEGSLGVAGHGGPAVSPGTAGRGGSKGLGGATAGTATGGVAGHGSAGASGVPGGGGARPAGTGGAAGGMIGSGGVAATGGAGGGQAPRGTGGVAAGTGGVKGTGGAPASTGGAVGSGGHPASTGGTPGSGGVTPPPGTGGITPPPMGTGGAPPPPPGTGGAGGSGTAGRSGGGPGGSPATEDCDQLIKDYDAAMADAKVCKAGDVKGPDMKGGGCDESVPAKLAGCGSECTTFVHMSAELDAIQKKWNKAGCSAAACLISLCLVNPTSGTCSPSGMCTDDTLLGL